MDFKNDRVYEFIQKLASDSPVPGGGGAAALTAALSGALSSMVFNLTIGKKSFEAMDDEIKSHVRQCLEDCKEKIIDFQEFMTRDGEAFSSLMEAYKLPKSSEDEIRLRDMKIQEGLSNSMLVPYNLAKEVLGLYNSIEAAALYGNKNVISDAGVSAILAHGAAESCILNVMVNLKFLSGDNDEIKEECRGFLEKSKACKDRIMEMVYSKI
ncbi:MAG: cyclodeaminase/cyclohydrolase family protein [Bacillota bacterium]|nr:cyclodeaminase/cyclohydrolase family protein [Bacillota bacterium]